MSETTAQFSLNLMPERRVWKVHELTASIRELLERGFQNVWVEGEISNLRPAQSGHLYFTLKDVRAQIKCVCFKSQARLLKFQPEDGMQVTVRGSVGVYVERGEYQVYVEAIEPVGLGALQLAFEQLKKKLEAEGLFDAARKKPLPVLPQRIGIVTSPSGAAVRDIVRILKARFPNVRALVFPARVQGPGAADDVIRGIRFFNRGRLADVLIVARGGGSLEDLQAFNDEGVARAIAASEIPIISGVGHETDFTIADFAADVRASTPSNAAEIVVRTRKEFDAHVAQLERQLLQLTRLRMLTLQRRLQELVAHRGFRSLEELLRQRRQRVDELGGRLGDSLSTRLDRTRRRFEVAGARLASVDLRGRVKQARLRLEQRAAELRVRVERALLAQRRRIERLMTQLDERSPLRVLERGYAMVTDASGTIVRDAAQVSPGDEIAVQLWRGRLSAEVKEKI